MVCDNSRVNHKILKLFGLRMDLNNLNTVSNLINAMGYPIYILLDVPHLIKLVRNTIADLKVLVDSNGDKIEWKYFVSLHKLQTEEGLHMANKLRKSHVEHFKNRMKVYIVFYTTL